MNGLDGFSGNLLICIVGVFLTGVLACFGWLIVRSIDNFKVGLQAAIDNLKNATKESLQEIGQSLTSIKNDVEKNRTEASRQFEKVRSDADVKFSEIQKTNAQDQRDMEARWQQALKDTNDKADSHRARVSEISEALLALKLDMYKDFMPTTAIKELVGELKALINSGNAKIDGLLASRSNN